MPTNFRGIPLTTRCPHPLPNSAGVRSATELEIASFLLRGFVKLTKNKKSEKNSEVGGWVKPQLGFFFRGEFCGVFCVLCVVVMFPIVSKKNKKLGRRVGGYGLTNPSFSRIFGFVLT